jgi:hypothetical protein
MQTGVSHRRAMTAIAALYALGAVAAGGLIVHYDATHDSGRTARYPVPGTPFTLRNGPSRTPERFAAWNRWAEYGLIAFQRYANRSLGGGIRRPVDVVLNLTMECDERAADDDRSGETVDHRICLYLYGLSLKTDIRESAMELAETAAHEAAHVWAFEHGCTPEETMETLEGLPDRLDEGIASDLAWHALAADGASPKAQALHLADLRRDERALRHGAAGGPLDLRYDESEIRAHLLADGHPRRYATYCHMIATTDHDERLASWRAFGRLG